MLIKANSELGRRAQLVDCFGRFVPGVKSFDTETNEAELYILSEKTTIMEKVGINQHAKPLLVKVKIRGARVLDRETGDELEFDEGKF